MDRRLKIVSSNQLVKIGEGVHHGCGGEQAVLIAEKWIGISWLPWFQAIAPRHSQHGTAAPASIGRLIFDQLIDQRPYILIFRNIGKPQQTGQAEAPTQREFADACAAESFESPADRCPAEPPQTATGFFLCCTEKLSTRTTSKFLQRFVDPGQTEGRDSQNRWSANILLSAPRRPKE